MKTLLLCGLAALLASAAWSLPTAQGWSGGFQVPTADIQQGVTLTVDQTLSQNSRTRSPYYFTRTSIPQTQLLVGMASGLEFSLGMTRFAAGYDRLPDFGDTTNWQATVKYALPWTLKSARLAVGLAYETMSLENAYYNVDRASAGNETFTNWSALIAGTLPLSSTIDGTLAVSFNHAKISSEIPDGPGGLGYFTRAFEIDENDNTTFAFGLEKRFTNQTRLGLEYLFNTPYGANPTDGQDVGNAYVSFPINEMLTGRVVFTGITEETSILVGVSAKL